MRQTRELAGLSRFNRTSKAVAVCLFLMFVVTAALAQSFERIVFHERPDHVLLEYSVRHALLAENDPQPLLQIFGDGRARVHIPAYMKRAGDYEMTFSRQELQALLRELIHAGIMTYRERAALDQQQQSAGTETLIVSDSTYSEITLNVHGVKLANSARIEPIGGRRHSLRDIQIRARHYPQIQSLVGLSAIQTRLESLCKSDRLRRVD